MAATRCTRQAAIDELVAGPSLCTVQLAISGPCRNCGEGQCRVYLKNYASAVQDILSVAELIICDHKKLTQKHTKIRLWCCHVHLRQRSRSCRAVIIDIIVGRMFRSLSLSRTRVVKQFSFSMIKKKSCLKMQLSYVNSTKSYEALRVLGLGIKEYE